MTKISYNVLEGKNRFNFYRINYQRRTFKFYRKGW